MAAKNTDLPGIAGKGVAPVSIEAVDKLVDKYVELRNTRMDYTKLEVEAKHALIGALHQHEEKIGNIGGTIVYRHDDMIVTLRSGKEELKVQTKGEPENEE